jgi:thymidylate kinase
MSSLTTDAEAGLRARLDPVHLKALRALSSLEIPYLVMRTPVPGEPVHDLDVLVDEGALGAAGRALRGAGLLPKTSPLGMPSKIVFTGYGEGRFRSLDVHTTVVSRGLVYLDAGSLLARRVVSDGIPVTSDEDSLLHLVLHPLLGRREIGGKYSSRIVALASAPLDQAYMRSQLERFGLGPVFDEALAAILGHAKPEPDDLYRRARARLSLRVPRNMLRRVRYRLAASLRFRRRAALVVFVGVDGVGKSSLVNALEKRLSSAGLRTGAAYLGSWGRYETKARWVRSFSLRDAEGPESASRTLVRSLKNIAKIPLFYGGLVYEQAVRYRRSVVLAHTHLVLSDRYIYDLEVPFSRRIVRAGGRARRWIYRLFPAPDLIFHLQGEPHEILSRKEELREDQIRQFDEAYGRVLEGRGAIRLRVDALPEELAERIVEGYWRAFLQASWRRAGRTLLPCPNRRALEA